MKWRSVLSKAAALLVIAATACQPAATPAPTVPAQPAQVEAPTPSPAPTPTPSPVPLSGEIKIDGSSTVYPISEAVAEEFQKANPGVKVVVGISGTGGGFKKFCNGETDISNASRPILQKEIDACAQNGIEYIELPVAYDALSVVVNPRNGWVACMTVAELKKIWEPDAQGKITRWNQVRPEWPDAPLNLYGAGTDSGTFDYFTEAIVGKAKASRGDYTASEDDNVLVQGVANDQYALGYFGLAYYFENQDKLKAVAIDNGKGCVLPSEETVRNGTYQPLSRPLFIYVSRKAADRPEVEAFVRFYLEKGPALVKQVGYVPLPDAVYQLALKRFEARKVGTLFKGEPPVGLSIEDLLKAEQ
jgi:phosphate transport system substrate-binding protein